jgi:hypothetical protein
MKVEHFGSFLEAVKKAPGLTQFMALKLLITMKALAPALSRISFCVSFDAHLKFVRSFFAIKIMNALPSSQKL